MPGPMGGGMRGPGRRMQGGTRIENPVHFITAAVSFILCIPKYNPIADTTSKIHPPAPLNGLLVPPVFIEPKSSR